MRPQGKLPLLTASIGLASIGLASPCWGAGPWLAETGGADMGMAGAGRAAMALDAASLAANPAALAGLSGTTMTAAVMPLRLDYEFLGSDDTPATATNQEGASVVPALFAIHQADRLAYGIGVYSYFGLAFDSGNQWAGRRVIEKAGIATLNIAPGVAWEATDQLTLGVSVAGQLMEPMRAWPWPTTQPSMDRPSGCLTVSWN